jgi:hypothetical protein
LLAERLEGEPGDDNGVEVRVGNVLVHLVNDAIDGRGALTET